MKTKFQIASQYSKELEHGLTVVQPCTDETVWLFYINCKKFYTIQEIVLLFRGDEDTGLLAYLDKGELIVNGVALEELEKDNEDPRVCEFPSSRSPLPLFAFDTLEIKISFLKKPPYGKDKLRIIANVIDFPSNGEYEEDETFEYEIDCCTFIRQKDKSLTIEKTKYAKILDIFNDSDDNDDTLLHDIDLDFGFSKAKLLSYDLDYFANWKKQRKLLQKSITLSLQE